MTLTIGTGPFGGQSHGTFNFDTGVLRPHILYFEDSPRRVRVMFNGETIADSKRVKLLHETGHLPVYYFLKEDVRMDVLEESNHTTHCPFKGDASYWSVKVGDTVAENAVWGYPEPLERAPWLAGRVAFYWDSMDAWYDEDERVAGGLRNPYHRVDVRASSRKVRVLVDGTAIAETSRPLLLSETGLPNRFYVPREDVRHDVLRPSETRTVCPYKGTAAYWSVRVGDTDLADAAWSYPDAVDDAIRIKGYLSFDQEALTVEVSP